AIEPIAGGVLAVPGMRGGATCCGLYDEDREDLALFVADRVCAVAGVFTRNAVPAAPVVLTRQAIVDDPRARSIVINAGNANALTGEQGWEAAAAMRVRTEERCGGPALVLSTGVIGVPLPVDRVLGGIDAAAAVLSADDEAPVARAILTTDTRTKTAAVRVSPPGRCPIHIGGVAKGSGMIHPNMATMLAVVAIDAKIDPAVLRSMLTEATDRSFHRISVDGDTSTNDAVLVLARPTPGASIEPGSAAHAAVREGLTGVCANLAEQIVADGEGVSKVLQVEIAGAETEDAARRVAQAVACSLLVKTAVAGRDPNWGRIIAVAGNAGVPIDPSRIRLTLGGVDVFRDGAPVPIGPEEERRIFGNEILVARLDLGQGTCSAKMLTTDLTYEYVRINAEYTT
ncbi:MAG: bifunctional glutamate N-acetyltransferase/amino-acid acetyltransferase ArgJ, partial [Candidatus Eisenbacteria bacterium]|nr:bifunctional glutamate N-acetyltransferase/amino-acid acetyltransferase ArgJ [Candidatus Eisenbacteria bacterium]